MYLYPAFFMLHVSDYLMLDRVVTLIVAFLCLLFLMILLSILLILKLKKYSQKGIKLIVGSLSGRTRILKLYFFSGLGEFEVLLCFALSFQVPISIFQWHAIFIFLCFLNSSWTFSAFNDWLNTKRNYASSQVFTNDQEKLFKRYTYMHTVMTLTINIATIPILLLMYDGLTDFPKLQSFVFD